ncbi:hypothetical protein D7294_03890 [Streptomyces hoynatensis]|uniref:Uncharacterized protein n=2 Tax=Streptomyces hoynatensis TaxID=1141874 RepID=A0A3A9ZCQ3_9ACTN|nr:hypothetical protein D7294_03890 [Streptomyces hoynatensis]
MSTILEGEVVGVADETPGEGWVTVTVDVQDWIKPAEGPRRVDLRLYKENVGYRTLSPGERLLFTLPVESQETSWDWDYAIGGEEAETQRALIESALPGSAGLGCVLDDVPEDAAL